MRTKVAKDGFVWVVLEKEEARALWNADCELERLYRDDSSCIIETDEDFEESIKDYLVGIGIGEVKDMLPQCPKCGKKLFPSFNEDYVWQCMECDEDFYAFEV